MKCFQNQEKWHEFISLRILHKVEQRDVCKSDKKRPERGEKQMIRQIKSRRSDEFG